MYIANRFSKNIPADFNPSFPLASNFSFCLFGEGRGGGGGGGGVGGGGDDFANGGNSIGHF